MLILTLMKRKYEKDLLNWIKTKSKKPLVLRGARQVGKSTLVSLFCKNYHYDLIEINLENIILTSLDRTKSFRLENLLKELELESSKKITDKTIIFFDEVQNSPTLIEKLRYFYEAENEYHIIAAGSLLEVVLEKENISMPVGRIDYLNIGPMDFEEYLIACNDSILINYLDNDSFDFFPINIYQLFLERFKEFLFIGGMPEAIKSFIKNNDFDEVRKIQKSILLTYRDDIPKYAKRKKHSQYVLDVFNYCFLHIGQKVKFSSISKANSDQVKSAIQTLSSAHIITPCFYSSSSGLPLYSQSDNSVMKLYFLDIGLMNAAMDLDKKTLFKLNGTELITKGMIVEQFIAQHLIYLNNYNDDTKMYYWLNDKKGTNAEIDFIQEFRGKIIPIEVKSGKVGKMKSLFQFIARKKIKIAVKIDLLHCEQWNKKIKTKVRIQNETVPIDFELVTIPAFFITKLHHFLSSK